MLYNGFMHSKLSGTSTGHTGDSSAVEPTVEGGLDIASDPLQTDRSLGLHRKDTVSKSSALAAIICQPAILQRIGSAWPLYFRLVLVEGGRLIGDYRRIGEMLGKPQSTVEKWVETLVEGGIAIKRHKGRGIEVALCETHMDIATMPEVTAPALLPEAETRMDTVTMGVLKVIEGTRIAGGAMKITVTVPNGSS